MSRSGHWVDEVCSHWATKLLRSLDIQAGFKLIVGDAVFGGLSRDWARRRTIPCLFSTVAQAAP